jgi:Reverse transcriptase (RNA-dependent DNA polymerase)
VSAYLNCNLEQKVYMSLDKIMSSLLIQLDSKTYAPYYDKDNGVIHVILKKALYGLVESARLFYNSLANALLEYGFKRNPYDQCVFNYVSDSDKQLTVCFHVDDLLCASECEDDLEQFASYLKTKFIDITINEGLTHDYLGMNIDFTEKGFCKLDMRKYIDKVLLFAKVIYKAKTPAEDNLYDVFEQSTLLEGNDKDHFHSVVACILYLAKRARPDLLTAVSFLTTRVLYSTVQDWNKLARLLQYMNLSKNIIMKLSSNEILQISCYVDASFANHSDYKSTSGCVLTLGSGAAHCKSSKQSLVTKSSTEAELVAISDCISVGIWGRNFLIEQNYTNHLSVLNDITYPPVILYQDNTSTIQLVHKGRSTSTRTRHVNIRYFFIHDRILLGEVKVVYKGTDLMLADIMTKPLQGTKFLQMRKMLLCNDEDAEHFIDLEVESEYFAGEEDVEEM